MSRKPKKQMEIGKSLSLIFAAVISLFVSEEVISDSSLQTLVGIILTGVLFFLIEFLRERINLVEKDKQS